MVPQRIFLAQGHAADLHGSYPSSTVQLTPLQHLASRSSAPAPKKCNGSLHVCSSTSVLESSRARHREGKNLLLSSGAAPPPGTLDIRSSARKTWAFPGAQSPPVQTEQMSGREAYRDNVHIDVTSLHLSLPSSQFSLYFPSLLPSLPPSLPPSLHHSFVSIPPCPFLRLRLPSFLCH
eukprot:760779-Hanusia_phi.AAC.2